MSFVAFQFLCMQKIWSEKKSSYKCIMLYPRWFDVTWGFPPHWLWNCYEETSDENIEVAKLMSVCWLNVRGQFKMSELSSGVVYEIAYIVKLTKEGFGWEFPVTLKLKVPEGREQKRQYSLLEKPLGEWIELIGGSFQAKEGETREVWFDICEHGGHWKSGLILKGIIIRPKH
ncbi:lectin [Rosa sericea]